MFLFVIVEGRPVRKVRIRIHYNYVYITKTFETAFSLRKTHQLFYVRNTPEKCKNATITGDRKAWVHLCRFIGWSNDNHWELIVSKISNFKMFFVHAKTQSRRFQISPVWRALSKSFVFRSGWVEWTFQISLAWYGRDQKLSGRENHGRKNRCQAK